MIRLVGGPPSQSVSKSDSQSDCQKPYLHEVLADGPGQTEAGGGGRAKLCLLVTELVSK